MPQTRSNQAQTPVNSDALNITTDLATMADSLQVVVTVANQAAGDAVATARAAAGFPVTDARPLFCWDQSQNALIVKGSSGWRGGIKPFGHAGKTNGFTAGGAVLNPVVLTSQILRGGMTFEGSPNYSLVVPLTGYYRVTARGYFSGGQAAHGVSALAYINGTASTAAAARWTKTQVDEYQMASCVMSLNAGDKVRLVTDSASSTWGSDGFNGAWIEVEFMDQW